MKFAIKHEIKGRLRVHMAQQRMTYEQADVLQYYLQQSDLVVDAKVYEQTADVVISYNGDRAAIIHLLCTFKYQLVEVPEGYLAVSYTHLRGRSHVKGEKDFKKNWNCSAVHCIVCGSNIDFLYGAGIPSEIH